MPLATPILGSLAAIPFFGGLEPAALERLAGSMRSRRFRRGEVIFHIRSRARSSSTPTRLGFLAIGVAMQTNTWTYFINRAAASVHAQIRDVIHADTERVAELPEDGDPLRTPTFAAVGD